jgi:hypothetical protein
VTAARPRGATPAGAAGARGTLVVALALALGIGAFLLREWGVTGAAGAAAFPLDDPWIHLHFARNLAEGHGFAYNPGRPVAGSTAPLWTLALAGAFAVLGSHPVLAKALGALAALGAALLARRLAERWTGDAALGVLGGVLTSLAGPMVWGALSGMEVALAALLVTAALCAPAASPWLPPLLLGLAALARPEAVLLVPLVWLAGPVTARRTLAFAGIVGALLAPWVAFNLATAGTPLPATAAAKIEGGLVGLFSGHRESLVTALVSRPWQFEVEWVKWLLSVNVLLPIFALAGLWLLARRTPRARLLPAALLVLHPLAMAVLAPYRGPGFQEGRYSIHLLPLAVVVAVAAVGGLTRPSSAPRRLLVAVLVVAALGALWPASSRYAWAVQNIEAMQVELGRWVARETPAGARLGLNDVGAIAYLSRREVVDLMGLVTPGIISYRREGDAGVFRYLERACPDYLIIFPGWFPELSARAEFTPIHRVRLTRNTVAGADEMVVYETVWNRWRPGRRSCP